MCVYIYIYIYICISLRHAALPYAALTRSALDMLRLWIRRSISEISSCFFGPRPWQIEIRHRVKKHPQLTCSDLRLSN